MWSQTFQQSALLCECVWLYSWHSVRWPHVPEPALWAPSVIRPVCLYVLELWEKGILLDLQPDSPQSVKMPPAEQFIGDIRWHHKNERLIINSVKWVVQLLWTWKHSASLLTFATRLFHEAKFIFKDQPLNGTAAPSHWTCSKKYRNSIISWSGLKLH